MEILPDKWVKPFSSALSCVNCIDAECVRGVSVEDCADICKKSRRCHFGYHVQLPNEKQSYCLPIDGFPNWGNPSIYTNSTFAPESSPILSPQLGVRVTAFVDPDITKVDEMSRSYISQLGIYLLRFRVDPDHPENDLYLMPDLTFGTDPNNALQIIVFRDLPVSSGISTAEETIRNGELVFIKNSQTNNIFYCRDDDTFGFFPYTIRWSSSTFFNVEDLYHTQLITKYPFDHKPIMIDDMFAIREGTSPIDLWVLYWDVDPQTKKLVMRRVTKPEMGDYSHLDRYKNFSLERQDKINIFEAENFVNSQSQYLINAFSTPSSNHMWSNILKIVIVSAILLSIVYVLLILFIQKRR